MLASYIITCDQILQQKINGLWIGGSLSTIELLSIASHVKQGHVYHLWTYQNMDVPKGVVLKDGNEILPESDIFCYSGPKAIGGGSFSAFSNLFRYKLLSERDEWWCDTDVVCLKPFNFDEPYAYATEKLETGEIVPTTCVMRIPREVAGFCYREGARLGKNVIWGEIGPSLFAVGVRTLPQYRKEPATFCPIQWWELEKIFQPGDLGDSHGVHLWNEMWRRRGIDKDKTYQPDSLLEELKRRVRPQPKLL